MVMSNYRNKLQPTLIALSIGLALNTVHAAELEEKSGKEVEEIEVIEVTGIRGSLSDALNKKRFSDQVLDSISAEDVGKLPDNNMAEALQRISGVSIQREFGEGGQVSVRGMGSSLNNVTVNGKILASSQQGREFNFSSLGSELISALEVYKSPLASQDEGSLGGTINLVTKGALDKKDNSYNVAASLGYDELSEETDPRLSFNLNKHITETFGVTFGVNYFDRNSRSDSYGALGQWKPFNYTPKMLNPNGNGKYVAATDLDGNKLAKGQLLLNDGTVVTNPLMPQQIQYSLRNGERERVGGNLGFHFQPSDEWDIQLSSMYSKLSHDDIAAAHQTRYDQNWAWTNLNYDADLNAILAADTAPHAGSKRAIRENWTERLMEEETISTIVDVKYIQDDWVLSFSAGRSTAHKYDDRTSFTGQESQSSSYDFTVGDSYYPSFDYNTAGVDGLGNVGASYHNFIYDDETEFAQTDFEYTLDNDYISSVELGVKYTERSKSNDREQTSIPGNVRPASLKEYETDFPVDDYQSFLPSYLDASNLPGSDLDAVKADYPQSDYEAVPKGLENWDVSEEYKAAYLQANINFGRLRGNFGVRYVETTVDSNGFTDDAALLPISVENTYDDTLPSINLTYAIKDNLLLRTSVAQVMARPSFKDQNAGGKIQEGSLTATLGNPELDPYRADQADLGLEWYFSDYGMASVAYFYKDIDTFIYSEQFADVVIPGYEFDENGEEQFFTVNKPANGTGGSFEGIELSWQQDLPFIKGAGFVANYTFTDSETELTNARGDKLPMEGVSEHSANLVAYYEMDNFSARITWNYRDDFMAKAVTLSGSPQFTKGSEYVDASIRYKLNKTFSFSLEGKNLTEEKRYQYVGDEQLSSAVRNDTGRVFTVGVRASF